MTKAPAAIVAATATASSQGIEAGRISIAISPKVSDIFKKLLGEAEAACGKKKRRSTCNINERFAQRVAEESRPGGLFDFIGTESRALLPTITGSDVAAIAGPALYVSPIVGFAASWVLLGKLQAWVLSPDSIAGGKGGEDDDSCPADAPKGDNAVRQWRHRSWKVCELMGHRYPVMTTNAKGTTRNAKRYVMALYSAARLRSYFIGKIQGL